MRFTGDSTLFGFFAVALVFFTVSGCATSLTPMALTTGQVDEPGYSVAIFTVVTRNVLKPNHHPELHTVRIRSDGGRQSTFRFDVPDEALSAYIASIRLTPGGYTILSFSGESNHYRLRGIFTIPVNINFELKENSIVYMGQLYANNRQRRKGERRSGPILPHIHQLESGFARGTFDVTVVDRYDLDIEIIRERYPSIADYSIERAILGSTDEDRKEK